MMAAFDPSVHIRKVSGADYLEVKWRIAWLRDVHPNANVVTDLYAMTQDYAVFKCVATLDTGATATGWGSEERKDFKDYIEKAETKAIGRALALLGFGTQFADDFADAPSGRIADAPVQRTQRPAPVPHTDLDGHALRAGIVSESKAREADRDAVKSPSWTAIYRPATAKGLNASDVQALARKRYGVERHDKLKADDMIDFADYISGTDAETLVAELAEAQ
jgi:hypothetical protein